MSPETGPLITINNTAGGGEAYTVLHPVQVNTLPRLFPGLLHLCGGHMGEKMFFQILVITILASLMIPVYAKEDTQELQQMVVSATRWETPGVSTASSIKIINREQIIQSGAVNVTDVLKSQAGLQIQDLFGDGSRTTISLRGFGNNGGANTLILVDGRRLNNTDLKTADISFISIKDVERIEIIEGSASVLYGDQAVGGAVNIITRKPDSFELGVQAGTGSYGRNLQRAKLANRFSNGIGFRVSAEHQRADNFRLQNDRDYSNFLANLDYQFERGHFFAEVIHVDEELETPGAIFPQQISQNRKAIGPFSTGDFNETVSTAFRLGGMLPLGANWDIAFEYTHRNEDADGLLIGTNFSQHRLARSFNPRLRGDVDIADQNMQIVLGADIENTEYKLISGVGDTINEQDMQALYTLIAWNINQQWSVIGGIRYADMENDSFKRDPFAAFPLAVDTFASKANRDNEVADSIGVVYKPDTNWRFFAKRETSFRFPLADELTGTVALFDDLQTQTGESYEAGLEWRQPGLETRLLAYQLELDDEIAFDQTRNFGIGANVNFDPTTRRGGIIDILLRPDSASELGINYAYVDAEFDEGPFKDNRIPLVARHQLNINGLYRLNDNLNLYGELLLYSDRIAGSDLNNNFPDLPGYGVVNMNLDYEYGNFDFALRANNLLDKEYSSSAALGASPFLPFFATDTGYYTAPERNFFFTIGYNFN